MPEIELNSKLTCPHCKQSEMLTMPIDSCQWFYECPKCHEILEPIKGDCCVFCSYGTIPCPPIQEGDTCCVKSESCG